MSRKTVAAVIAALWILLGWFVLDSDTFSKAKLDRVSSALSEPDPAWAKEDLYYSIENFRRTDSVALPHQLEVSPQTNPNRVRVLVLGDSFTYGQGLTDWSARWPARLQQFLDSKYGDGAVEVVALARPGANMTTYGSWVRTLRAGDFKSFSGSGVNSRTYSESLGDHFDLVLLGFVENDYLATDFDGYIPEKDYVDLPVEQWNSVIDGSSPNPYEKYFFAALGEVRSYAHPAPLVLLPLTTTPVDSSSSYNRFPTVRATGVLVEEPLEQVLLGSRHPLESLMVTPVDTHPNSAW